MFSEFERRELLKEISEVADRAGELILSIYETDFEVRQKNDKTPVTKADELSEALILPALRQLLPEVPAIGEEAVSQGREESVSGNLFWLVDPVDGTEEFIRRSGEFTVNIALIQDQIPILGIVGAPALNRTFRACGIGTAERRSDSNEWETISARTTPNAGPIVVSSRSHGDRQKLSAMVKDITVQGHKIMGSSLKFCLIAEGSADIYPRYGPTSEWDTAAGHAVLRGAGGCVWTTEERELLYGKAGWKNPKFLARGLL